MAVREGSFITRQLFRAGIVAAGYSLCLPSFATAAPDTTRTLFAESAPADATPAKPTDVPATPITPGGPAQTPAPESLPVAPESGAEVPVPSAPIAPEAATPEPTDEIVEPVEDSLHYPVNQWPVMAGQSPLFGTEQIAGFSEEEMLKSAWSLRPHFNLATVFDDNIYITKSNKKSDLITDVGAGLTLRIGHPEATVFLLADYEIGGEIFADHGNQDSLEQSGSIDLLMSFKKLTIGISASVSSGSVTSVDVGERVHETPFAGGINASYALGELTSITASLDESFAYYDSGFIGSADTEIQAFFNYQLRPKINVGIGGGFGLTVVEHAPSQTDENVSVRLLYTVTEKVGFSLSAGAEITQFGSGGGSLVSPVFSMGLSYSPRFGTHFELGAERSISPSASLTGQDFIATGVSFSVSQRVNENVSANFDVGYQNQSYEAAAAGVTATREDNFYYLRPGVQFAVAKWVNLSIYYEFSQNLSSGLGSDGFTRDRVGAQFGFIF